MVITTKPFVAPSTLPDAPPLQPHEKMAHDGYAEVFHRILNADKGVINKREHLAANYVMYNCLYSFEKPFTCQARGLDEKTDNGVKKSFHKFNALPSELTQPSPGGVKFWMAHEVKHATLSRNSITGTLNIKKTRVNLKMFSDRMEKYTSATMFGFHKARKAVPDSTIGKFIKDGLNITECLTTLPLKILGLGSQAIERGLSRKEEYLCDEFALRVFPDADLNEVKEALIFNPQEKVTTLSDKDIAQQEKTKQQVHDYVIERRSTALGRVLSNNTVYGLLLSAKSNIFDTHPGHEDRMRNLQKMQTKMKNESAP